MFHMSLYFSARKGVYRLNYTTACTCPEQTYECGGGYQFAIRSKWSWSSSRNKPCRKRGRVGVYVYPFLTSAVMGWVINASPRVWTAVRIVQKAGWVPGLVWTGHRGSNSDRPDCSESLYWRYAGAFGSKYVPKLFVNVSKKKSNTQTY